MGGMWAAERCVCDEFGLKGCESTSSGLLSPNAFLDLTFMLFCSDEGWQKKNGTLVLIVSDEASIHRRAADDNIINISHFVVAFREGEPLRWPRGK